MGRARPSLVGVVGKQPLLRTSIRQLAENHGYRGAMVESNTLAELVDQFTAARHPEALIMFKEMGDRQFYARLDQHLKRWPVKPRVALFSETLGEADWAAIEGGWVTHFLPARISRDIAAEQLGPLFTGARESDSVEVLRQRVEALQSLLMADVQDLTATQRRVVALLQRGLSNRDIAHHLGIPFCQIKKMLHDISTKLGVSGRLNIAMLARRQFLLSGQC